MMLLAIDVGNTNMVFGVFRGEALIGSFRLMTDTNRTSDEIGLSATEFFRRFGFDVDEVQDVIIASVVPQVMHTLGSAMVKYFGKRALVIDDDIDPGLAYGIESDERLGADRAVACISAIEKYGTPLVVLDFGTATTVDAINTRAEYLGGCITAGVRISTEALFRMAALLPRVELMKPETVIGKSTVGQIQAGAVCGYIGAIEHLVRETKREMACGGDENVKVVATGGLARMVSENSDVIDVLDNQLVLDGLRMVYDKYKEGMRP